MTPDQVSAEQRLHEPTQVTADPNGIPVTTNDDDGALERLTSGQRKIAVAWVMVAWMAAAVHAALSGTGL